MKGVAITQRVSVIPEYGERRDSLDRPGVATIPHSLWTIAVGAAPTSPPRRWRFATLQLSRDEC